MLKSGSLRLLESPGPVQGCTAIAVPFYDRRYGILAQAFSNRSSRATCSPRKSVRLPAETFKLTKCLSALSLAEAEKEFRRNFENVEAVFYADIIILLNQFPKKCAKNSDILACGVNCISYSLSLVLPVRLYCT